MQKEYPQNPKEWRKAIEAGLGFCCSEAENLYHSGAFPYARLEKWIHATFSNGYSPEFVPALQRNLKGLVSWVYGDQAEPFWPGSDQKLNEGEG